eukprot:9474935-Pyramimonas_sp.AAC.1
MPTSSGSTITNTTPAAASSPVTPSPAHQFCHQNTLNPDPKPARFKAPPTIPTTKEYNTVRAKEQTDHDGASTELGAPTTG